jgi:hypothetical protein
MRLPPVCAGAVASSVDLGSNLDVPFRLPTSAAEDLNAELLAGSDWYVRHRRSPPGLVGLVAG